MGGLIAYPFEQARDVLKFYRDVTAKLPDEHTIFGGLMRPMARVRSSRPS